MIICYLLLINVILSCLEIVLKIYFFERLHDREWKRQQYLPFIGSLPQMTATVSTEPWISQDSEIPSRSAKWEYGPKGLECCDAISTDDWGEKHEVYFIILLYYFLIYSHNWTNPTFYNRFKTAVILCTLPSLLPMCQPTFFFPYFLSFPPCF